MIDSHCHLDRLDCAAADALARARASGVDGVLLPGVDRAGFEGCAAIAASYSQVWMAAGIHPSSASADVQNPVSLDQWLRDRAAHDQVVALGETGLDFAHLDPGDAPAQQVQQAAFSTHLKAGRDLGLPVIVHTRDARAETLELLREGAGGVIHCFTEDLDFAMQALDLGYLISLSGIVTFRSADALRSVVRKLPLDGLLIETDAPWLSPVPMRGKPNEPAFVSHTAACVADLLGLPVERLTEHTDANFRRLFSV